MAVRAILVGCGAMSRGWLEAAASTALRDRVNVVGLVDVDRSAAESRAVTSGLSGVEIGTDIVEMLERVRPDVLFDVVPPSARQAVVAAGLERGCHVLSEKPMALSLLEARELVRLATASGRVHAIVQNRRFNLGVRRIRAMLDSGALGELHAIHSDFFVGAHFGGFRDQMQHVLLVDMAIHTFDAARYMAGKDPRAVYCHESNPRSSWYAHGSVANAVFEFSDDVLFTYRGSWSAEGANTNWDASWRIIGSKGTLLWDGADRLEAHVLAGDDGFHRPLREIDVPPPANVAETEGHRSVMAEFLDAIETGREPETSGRDNLKSLGMVFAAIESARLRQRVEICE